MSALTGSPSGSRGRATLLRAGPPALFATALLFGILSVGYAWTVARHLRSDARETSRLLGYVFAGLNDPREGAAADALLALADEVRRVTADKRDVGREVSLEHAIEISSRRLEEWLARDLNPHAAKQEDAVLQLVAALGRLPEAQRDAIILQYWSGCTLLEIAEELGRSREAVAGLIKRGLRQLRIELGATRPANSECAKFTVTEVDDGS